MNNTSRKIKKYENRKLYDLSASAYVNLNKLADLFLSGEELLILDNKTGKDITSETLLQVVVQKQKKTNAQIPSKVLREMMLDYLNMSNMEAVEDYAPSPLSLPNEEEEQTGDVPSANDMTGSFWSE
jgi:polyhydroxyalkanoate synthesis repressor PhaR